ncbi:MAG TPA: hypothetical protein ENI61_00720 [Ignavibacteria bacterium]|nr:hypothetical protein [Ignavibacteria bacterium]
MISYIKMENIIDLNELFWIFGLTLFTTTMIFTYNLLVLPYLKNIMTPTSIILITSLFIILMSTIYALSLTSIIKIKGQEML